MAAGRRRGGGAVGGPRVTNMFCAMRVQRWGGFAWGMRTDRAANRESAYNKNGGAEIIRNLFGTTITATRTTDLFKGRGSESSVVTVVRVQRMKGTRLRGASGDGYDGGGGGGGGEGEGGAGGGVGGGVGGLVDTCTTTVYTAAAAATTTTTTRFVVRGKQQLIINCMCVCAQWDQCQTGGCAKSTVKDYKDYK